MPWLTLENTGNASGSISPSAEPGNPALFVSRLGAWNVSDRPEWLRPVDPSALTEPEADQRVMVSSLIRCCGGWVFSFICRVS